MNILKVQLTAENIKNINSNAIPVLPAPGINKQIIVHELVTNLIYGSTPFDSNQTLSLTNDPSNPSAFSTSVAIDDSTSISKKAGNASWMVILPNTPLYICGDQDSVAGNSTIDAYIVYSVIDL